MSFRVLCRVLAALVLFPLCHPNSAEAQFGLALRGSIQGLPAWGITLPTSTQVPATLYTLVERGSSALPVPVVFAAGRGALRTADVSAVTDQTHIVNGQFLELHVVVQAGQFVVRVVREVPSVRVTAW